MPDTSVSTTPILNAADVREQERRHDFANLNSPGILYVIGWPGASRTCSIRQTGAYLGMRSILKCLGRRRRAWGELAKAFEVGRSRGGVLSPLVRERQPRDMVRIPVLVAWV